LFLTFITFATLNGIVSNINWSPSQNETTLIAAGEQIGEERHMPLVRQHMEQA